MNESWNVVHSQGSDEDSNDNSVNQNIGANTTPGNPDPNNDDGDDDLGSNWKTSDIKDSNNWNGCEACARDIQQRLRGGKIVRITPQDAPSLGSYRGTNPGWAHHEVVVKNGRVYDAFTGSRGLPIETYKRLWQYPEAIKFGF